MLRNHIVPIYAALMLLAACAPVMPPPPTPTPTVTPTPSPTPTPAPTPTATPIPPLALTIRWPHRVLALEPVPIEVELVPPPGIAATATVRAIVTDPEGAHQAFDLNPQEGSLYAADEPLQLPLLPPEGDWQLVVYVRSELDVEGQRELIFQPAPIRFRDLADVLPARADLRVPQDFEEVTSLGDQVAGGRLWRYEGGEVALWWAPGPAEPLLLNNAVVMLETTLGTDAPEVTEDVEEMEWQDQAAFLFREEWPGAEGGPGEALVVQGPDLWLYVLRVRAVGGGTIPSLLRQVGETFAFVEE